MSRKIKEYIPLVSMLAIVCMMIFSPSCANTTTPPSGGPKDTIPPVIVKMSPMMGDTMIARHKTNISITFNEFVTVKDPKSLTLSPPLEKAPKHKLRGKSVVVYFENDLDSNQTYTLDITNAIADNNEGNMYPGYTLVFSTGNKIDSMMITGLVQDCNTLAPIKGATVMLYKDHADSAIFLSRPDACARTDDWGFFCLRNIQDTLYRMYAIVDENSNYIYEPETEQVAFIDTLVRPTKKVNDTIPELMKYLMTDTLGCMARKTEIELNMFKEKPVKQMILNKERIGERTAYITFMAENPQIDSMWIAGIPSDKLITQFNLERDSLEIWINDSRRQPDTLMLYVDYMKTDTTGMLAPFTEEIKLTKPRKTAASMKQKREIKPEDTTTVFTINAKSDLVEQYGFQIEFKYPLVEEAFDSLIFKSINPKQQEQIEGYTVEKDSLNLRKYIIRPKNKLQQGFEYILKVPDDKFKDINGFYNDSSEVKVTLPTDDKLSSMTVVLKDVNNKYIIDLLDEKRTNVIRSFTFDNDTSLLFPYLRAGKYSIRLTEDINRNGRVDTGNLLQKKQPEKVKFYKLTDDNMLIDIMEMMELSQTINVKELFK